MTPRQVVEYYDHCQSTAARALKCRQSTISMWVKRGFVPELAQYRIERATGGKLRANPKTFAAPRSSR